MRGAHLTFLANPNSPSGTAVGLRPLERLAEELDGPLVVDEAYVDFADANGLAPGAAPNVIVTRSLSKSYCAGRHPLRLRRGRPGAGPRAGQGQGLVQLRCAQPGAAAAALEDQEYLHDDAREILATRRRWREALGGWASSCRRARRTSSGAGATDRPVKPIYEELKRRMILVRYMNYEGYGDGLRISVGTDAEIDRLLDEMAPKLLQRNAEEA